MKLKTAFKLLSASILSSTILIACEKGEVVRPQFELYKNAKVMKVDNNESCYRGCNPNVELKIGDNRISLKAKNDVKPLLHKGNTVNVRVDKSLFIRDVKLSDSSKQEEDIHHE